MIVKPEHGAFINFPMYNSVFFPPLWTDYVPLQLKGVNSKTNNEKCITFKKEERLHRSTLHTDCEGSST